MRRLVPPLARSTIATLRPATMISDSTSALEGQAAPENQELVVVACRCSSVSMYHAGEL